MANSFGASRTVGTFFPAGRVPSPVSEDLKQVAGEAALAYLRDGMTVGLGTGSTVAFTIRKLGEVVRERRWRILRVATSPRTAALAISLRVPLVAPEDVAGVDA